MENIYLLEAQHMMLGRMVENLSIILNQRDQQKVLIATKQFIATLCQYLELFEKTVLNVLNDVPAARRIRQDRAIIESDLEDIYALHVTEPDGQFARVMKKIIEAVSSKLDADNSVLESIKFLSRANAPQTDSIDRMDYVA